MKQVNVRVDDELGEALYRFCDRQGITPYDLLRAIVGFYGRGQLLIEKAERRELAPDEALIALSYMIPDRRKFTPDKKFLGTISELLRRHGVDLRSLLPCFGS